jgi:hypothetical protein
LVDEIEQLAEQSDLPEKVNRKFWDEFIVHVYEGGSGIPCDEVDRGSYNDDYNKTWE